MNPLDILLEKTFEPNMTAATPVAVPTPVRDLLATCPKQDPLWEPLNTHLIPFLHDLHRLERQFTDRHGRVRTINPPLRNRLSMEDDGLTLNGTPIWMEQDMFLFPSSHDRLAVMGRFHALDAAFKIFCERQSALHSNPSKVLTFEIVGFPQGNGRRGLCATATFELLAARWVSCLQRQALDIDKLPLQIDLMLRRLRALEAWEGGFSPTCPWTEISLPAFVDTGAREATTRHVHVPVGHTTTDALISLSLWEANTFGVKTIEEVLA